MKTYNFKIKGVNLVVVLFLPASWQSSLFPAAFHVCCNQIVAIPFNWSTGGHRVFSRMKQLHMDVSSCQLAWLPAPNLGCHFVVQHTFGGWLSPVLQTIPTLSQWTSISVKAYRRRARLLQNQKVNSHNASCWDCRLQCHKQLSQPCSHPIYPDCIVSWGNLSPNLQLFT